MRIVLALLTLCAASTGFYYLDESHVQATQNSQGRLRPLHAREPSAVRPFAKKGSILAASVIRQIETQSDSLLDDFIASSSFRDQSLDDTFNQIASVAKSTVSRHSDSMRRVASSGIADKNNRPFVPQFDVRTLSLDQASPAAVDNAVPVPLDQEQSDIHEGNRLDNEVRESEPLVNSNETSLIAQVAGETASSSKPIVREVKRESRTYDWIVAGKTHEGRPMHTRRFGDNGPRTMIIAGLDGKDRIAVRWIDQLGDELAKRNDVCRDCEVLLFRAANPDGLTRSISENSRAVLINRNFPSRRFRLLPDFSSGRGPGTEPETRAVLDAVYSFHPRRMIHLMATKTPSVAIYNRRTAELAEELKRKFEIPIRPIDIERHPGSIEDFADGTIDSGVMQLQLAIGENWERAWSKHQSTIVAAVSGRFHQANDSRQREEDELTRSSPDQLRTPIPVSNSEVSRKKIRRGYEELPPPPR